MNGVSCARNRFEVHKWIYNVAVMDARVHILLLESTDIFDNTEEE